MTNVASSGIYFLQEGSIEMSIMPRNSEEDPEIKVVAEDDNYHPLILLSEGSYFGDISYIF